jgi:hypothetical protein
MPLTASTTPSSVWNDTLRSEIDRTDPDTPATSAEVASVLTKMPFVGVQTIATRQCFSYAATRARITEGVPDEGRSTGITLNP